MSKHRSRAGRAQKVIAIILLLCLALSGLAIYAAATSVPAGPPPTQQSR
ncbi:MAG TPA: hypothetical protein VHB98_13510 [Chloroflexota bacterium]|jgi:hypothetical protein|nr:hypothetical protein [Chloroflexota bacterium]